MSPLRHQSFLTLLLILATTLPLAAEVPVYRQHDVVVTANDRIKGTIKSRNDREIVIELEKSGIIRTLQSGEVVEVIPHHETPRAAYREFRERRPESAQRDELLAVAAWCRDHDLHWEALEELRKLMAIEPDPDSDLHDRGLALAVDSFEQLDDELEPLGGGEEQEELTEIELYFIARAKELGLTTTELRLLNARVLERLGLDQAALEELEALLQQLLENGRQGSPEHRQAAERLARLYLNQLRFSKALEVLRGVRESGSASIEVLHLMGDAAFGTGQVEEAARLWEQAGELEPGNPQLRLRNGIAAYFQSRLDEAAVELQDVAQSPDLAPDSQVRARYYLALVKCRQGKFEGATALFEGLRGEAASGTARANLGLGFLQQLLGNPSGALDYYQQAATEAGTGELAAQAHYLRAVILADQKDVEGAARALNEAANVGLPPGQAFMTLARWYAEAGQADEARRYLEFSRALRPDDPRVLYLLGRTALQLEDWNEAERYFRQLLEGQPGHHGALAGLAFLRYRANDYQQEGANPLESAKGILATLTESAGPGDEDDPYQQYAQRALEGMRRTETRLVLMDNFFRPRSGSNDTVDQVVRNNWLEVESSGVPITLDKEVGVVKMGGSVRPEEMVFLSREITPKEFPWLVGADGKVARRAKIPLVEVRARVDYDEAEGLEVGLRLESTRAGSVWIYKDAGGRLAYNYTKAGESLGFPEPDDPKSTLLPQAPTGGYQVLGIELGEKDPKMVRFTLNGETRPEWELKHPGFNGNWKVSVFARAPGGGSGSWEVLLDSVEMFIMKPEKR